VAPVATARRQEKNSDEKKNQAEQGQVTRRHM
jgi:hypothetical protein